MSRLWLGDQVTNIRLQPGAAVATAVRSGSSGKAEGSPSYSIAQTAIQAG
jgi:hypothetical protein